MIILIQVQMNCESLKKGSVGTRGCLTQFEKKKTFCQRRYTV